jgi:DNA-binding Xre family transcriptional regulator
MRTHTRKLNTEKIGPIFSDESVCGNTALAKAISDLGGLSAFTLQTTRAVRDLTQKEVACRAGMSVHTLSRLERAKRRVRPDEARRLASVLRCKLEDLL